MEIVKKDNYTLVSANENSFETFLENFTKNNFSDEHLLIDVLSLNITSEQADQFSNLSTQTKEAGYSFIIISNSVEIDDLEDEMLSVVPTLGEAEDTLEMDAIERDLGL